MKAALLIIIAFLWIVYSKGQNQNLNSSILPIEIGCVHFEGESIVIKNQEDYDAIYNPFTYMPECENYRLPEIDFNEFVLVGIDTSCGGGIKNITEDLVIDNVYNTCQFVIKIYIEGYNRRLNKICFWRLIQKKTIENYNYEVKILQYQL